MRLWITLFQNIFVFCFDTLTYNLRDSDCSLAIPQPHTGYCRSLSYSGAVLWNSLPLDIWQSPSLNEFESKLKNFDFDSTVEPRLNEPLFNEVLDIANNILRPGQSYSKICGIEPRYNEHNPEAQT